MNTVDPNQNCHNYPSSEDKKKVANESIVFVVFYFVLLIFVCRNFYKNVYLNKKYMQPLVMIFYTFAFLTCIFQIMSFSAYAYINAALPDSHTAYRFGNSLATLGSIATLNIGIFQCLSM